MWGEYNPCKVSTTKNSDVKSSPVENVLTNGESMKEEEKAGGEEGVLLDPESEELDQGEQEDSQESQNLLGSDDDWYLNLSFSKCLFLLFLPCAFQRMYTVEYAKTGRASCKLCNDKIVKGELRIGKQVLVSST